MIVGADRSQRFSNFRIAALFTVVAALTSCEHFRKNTFETRGTPVARVDEEYLYYSDIETIARSVAGTKDSSSIVKSHVDEWIKRKLMMQKAQEYLRYDKTEVDRQVEDYRESLILYAYEQELILQKLDTTVSQEALMNYYEEYKTNFTLKNDVVQMVYVKAPTDAPRLDSVSRWLPSRDESDQARLEDYGHRFATDFSLSDSAWFELPDVYDNIPLSPYQFDVARLNRNVMFVSDSLYNYVMKVNDFRPKGEVAPFHFVKSDITRIILNKRKNELVRSTFENVYLEGKRNKKFEIYAN